MSEWLKETDCKSVALRYVGSNPTRPNIVLLTFMFYNPTMLIIILYKIIRNKNKKSITRIRNLGTLNKFLNGAKITKIKPAKLLIKKRG